MNSYALGEVRMELQIEEDKSDLSGPQALMLRPTTKRDEENIKRSTSDVNLQLIEGDNVDWSRHTLPRRPWRRRVTDFERIIKHRYRGQGTPQDPFIVQWLNDDPENPLMYPFAHKVITTILVSLMCLCVSLASSAYTGVSTHVIDEFQCSREVFTLGLSLMVLGFGVGPILWGPLSEVLGRQATEHVALVFYTLWTAVCSSAQNIQSLIVFRFLAGCTGSALFVIPPGQVADLFEARQRGVALALFSVTPFSGPVLGPMIGGFLGDAAGWRWFMGFLALYALTLTLAGLLGLPETYAPVLLRRRAALLSKVTGKCYMTKIDYEQPPTIRRIAKQALVRPWALLFREPIVLALSVYMAVVYGTLYLFFAAFPLVFRQGYGWSAGVGGLSFMGTLVGMLLAAGIMLYDNKRYSRIHEESGGFAPPEARLPPAILGGALTITGLAWFAASATSDGSIHWAVPILAGVPFGTGFILVFMCLTNYLVDAYVIYAASVITGSSILRCAFAAAFPLFTVQMYTNLGVHWASAVPGFIALACFPFPILFSVYGPAIRSRCKYSAQAAGFLASLKNEVIEQETSSLSRHGETSNGREADTRDSAAV